MLSLRVWLLLFWALYLGLKVIRWTISKCTTRGRCKNFTDNVTATFKCDSGDRFNLTVRADVCNKHEVGADDTTTARDVINAQIDGLENHMCDFGYKMTNLEAENFKSGKKIIDYLQTLGERIENIEKYIMATKSRNESHHCCDRSTELTFCIDNNKIFKNVLETFEKASDEFKDSMNRKIDQLKIEIVTKQTNYARDRLSRSSATTKSRTINAHIEVTFPAQPPLTDLLTITSDDIGIEVPQLTPAMSVTLARPEPLNNDGTGNQNTWTELQQDGSDVTFGECSSDDGWSEDENGFIPPPPWKPLPLQPVTSINDVTEIISQHPPLPSCNDKTRIQDTWTAPLKAGSDVVSGNCSSEGWSKDEKGYIPPQPRRPLPPLPVMLNNDVTGISWKARSESLGNDKTGIRNTCTALRKAGSDAVSKECSSHDWSEDEKGFIPPPPQRPLPSLPELLDDHDNIFQDSQFMVQEFRPERSPEESFPNK